MTTARSADTDTEAREDPLPRSEPSLARRPPAELMVYSTNRPPSIRMAAHSSAPPRSEAHEQHRDGTREETGMGTLTRYLSAQRPFAS